MSDADLLADFKPLALASAEQWASLEWRLDHLYWIVDKDGKRVPFVLNREQRSFVGRLWHRNLILKARQLGFSTLMQLLSLDQAIFNVNFNAVVITDTLPNAGKLFGKVEFAYNNLNALLQQAYPLATKNKGSGLSFAHPDPNGREQPSTISVSVSSRGGTVQLLHVSELAKTARKYPDRAKEIVTGAFESVPLDGCIVVESTAEGAFGEFYDLCAPAMKRRDEGKPETKLDWRLHFYPWFDSPDYRLSDEDTAMVEVSAEMRAYFDSIEAKTGTRLDANQRAWYAKKSETLGSKMKQEYPATPEEAFEQAIEGAIYAEQMTAIRKGGRLTLLSIDPNYPVNTFWDFGVADSTAVWFHQCIHGQHRWFYYFESSGKGLRYYWLDVLEPHRKRHGYTWGTHHLPHDADAEILGEVVTTKHRILEDLGMGRGEGGRIVVVPRVATISQGIEITRKALGGNHWFDKRAPDEAKGEDMGAGQGIKCLDAYQFKWDEKREVWSDEPLHNWASHGCDAWRQHAQGWSDSAANDDDFAAFKRRARNWR